MKYFALIVIGFSSTLAHAGMTTTYRCSFGGYPVGNYWMNIELLADGSANVSQFPPLARYLNPAKVEAVDDELKLTSQVEAGPFPGNPEIRKGEVVVFFNPAKLTMRFPSYKDNQAVTVGCTKVE